MLTRSVVAALCGALAVAGLPGQGEYRDYVEPYRGYDLQETFAEVPQWAAEPSELLDDEEDSKPHFPHPGKKEPPVDDKTIYQALKEDSRCALSCATVAMSNARRIQVHSSLQARQLHGGYHEGFERLVREVRSLPNNVRFDQIV